MSHDLPAVREQILPPAHFMDPASGMPPLISFEALASGEAPLIYRPANVPERARITKAMARAAAAPATRTRHGFRGGLAAPDVWEDLLAAAGSSAQVFVYDQNGYRWRVEEVAFDYGGETGKIQLRNVGPLGMRWVRLHEAYGRMIPVVQYKARKTARNPDDQTRALERQLAGGDESAHAPLLAAMLRAGDVPKVQLEVLAALGDPLASQVVAPPVKPLIFRNARNQHAQYEWLQGLASGHEGGLAFGDLILAAGRAVHVATEADQVPVNALAINTMYQIARNAVRHGWDPLGRRMFDAMEGSLRRRFAAGGEDYDRFRIGRLEDAVRTFVSIETTPYVKGAAAVDQANRVLDTAWEEIGVRAGLPPRTRTPWLRAATASMLRTFWNLPPLPAPSLPVRTNPGKGSLKTWNVFRIGFPAQPIGQVVATGPTAALRAAGRKLGRADLAVTLVRSNPGTPGCTIVPLDEDAIFDVLDDVTDRDAYVIMEEAERLFSDSGIRISSVENLHEACLNPEGRVVGVSVAGLSGGYDEGDELQRPLVTFSIAVSEDARRRGVANALLESLIDRYPNDEFLLEGKVVNPHMVPLLKRHGFHYDDESQYTPGEWTDWDSRSGRRMYRPNPSRRGDRRLRELERLASMGEPGAREALHHERIKTTGLVPETHRIGFGAVEGTLTPDGEIVCVRCSSWARQGERYNLQHPANARCVRCGVPVYLPGNDTIAWGPTNEAAVAFRALQNELRVAHGIRLNMTNEAGLALYGEVPDSSIRLSIHLELLRPTGFAKWYTEASVEDGSAGESEVFSGTLHQTAPRIARFFREVIPTL